MLAVHMKPRLSLLQSRLKRRLLALSPKEASFARRRFPSCRSSSRRHLEDVIRTFIAGYGMAQVEPDMHEMAHRLDSSFSPAFVGFAYEGAGLYFGLTDLLIPKIGSRLSVFTHSVAPHHDYIATVGAGFAVARAPLGLWRFERYQRTLDPMSAWCLADGYGFHQGFFHWKSFIEGRQAVPESFDLQNRRLFDAGVGRSMWWVFGADPASVVSAIARFPPDRQPEMWVGIGTALAYAGGGPPAAPSLLLNSSGAYRCDFLSGIFLAAHMRRKGGNPAEWTESVCLELLARSSATASQMIVAELTAFFDSWQGSEQGKWSKCYVELRERVKQRLADEHSDSL
jgi:enediyne biosynthesis protein E3